MLAQHLETCELDNQIKDQILASFYVDDNVFSEDTLELLVARKKLSVKIFEDAGMIPRQWNTNHPEARTAFFNEENKNRELHGTILGLSWDLTDDKISINAKRVMDILAVTPQTKRQLSSFVAQIYDPLGLISLYITKAKFILRDAAQECKGWDRKLPEKLGETTRKWTEEFVTLTNIRLPRYVSVLNPTRQWLIGFCNAIIQALGT